MRFLLLVFFVFSSASISARSGCEYFYIEMGDWFLPIPNGYYLRSIEDSDLSFYITFDDIDCHPGNPESICKKGESGFRVSFHDEVSASGVERWNRLDDWEGFSKYRAKKSALEGVGFEMVMYVRDGKTLSLVGSKDILDEYQELLDECAWEMER